MPTFTESYTARLRHQHRLEGRALKALLAWTKSPTPENEKALREAGLELEAHWRARGVIQDEYACSST